MPPTTVGPYTMRQSLASVLTSGLIRYYRLGETGGTVATDSSTSAHNGTYSATGVTYGIPSGVGDANTAVRFDGSAGWIIAPSSGLPTGASPVSFGCWMMMSAYPTGSGDVVMELGNNLGGQSLLLFVDTGINAGKITLGDNVVATSEVGPLALDIWHLVVATFDGANLRLYVDGVLAAGPTASALNLTYGGLSIGATVAPSNFFAGSVDEAFVCNIALDAVTIQAMYAWGNPNQRMALLESGTPFQVRVSTETIALYVQNRSTLTLYLAFQEQRPTAVDSTGGAYNAVVLPGHQALIPVQARGSSSRERSLNAMGAFTGSIWVMPRDYTNTQALTGTISQLTGVFVSAYGPYDLLPSAAVDQPAIDLSSQPRVIALPPPGTQVLSGTWTAASENPRVVRYISVPAATLASGLAPVYLFHLSLYPEAAATPLLMYCLLQVQPEDTNHNPLGGTLPIVQFVVASGQAGTTLGLYTPAVFSPTFPIATFIGLPANTAWLNVQLFRSGGSSITSLFNVAVEMDPNNLGFPAGYGGQTGVTRWAGQFSGTSGLW